MFQSMQLFVLFYSKIIKNHLKNLKKLKNIIFWQMPAMLNIVKEKQPKKTDFICYSLKWNLTKPNIAVENCLTEAEVGPWTSTSKPAHPRLPS